MMRVMQAGAIILFALVVCSSALHAVAAEPEKTVRLEIDYGDGVVKSFTALPWKDGVTVLDVMNVAAHGPHPITFKFSGSGDTAFLSAIDGMANEGGGVSRKNWQLWVNGKYGTRGFAVYTLQPRDTVAWRFATGGEGN